MAQITLRPSLAYSAPMTAKIAQPIDVVRARPDDDGYEPLAGLMGEVARELAADGVLVAWHDGDNAPVFLFASGACQPESSAEREMLESAALALAVRSPSAQPGWQTSDGELAHSDVMTTSIPTGGAIVTVTALFQRIGNTTRARTRDTAARLLPIVQGFFGLWGLRARALSRVRGLTAAIDRSDVGILLIDRRGQLVFANAAAERLIAQNDGLRRSGGALCATQLTDTLRLQASIQHVVAERGAAGASPAPVVALNRKDRRPLMAAIVASGSAAQAAEESAATVYVFDPDQDLRPLLDPVCRLYGLSPVESRLTCLLADGISLADAAKSMHVQEQTARSYLKQIFLKTDTNRQAELVWLMLKSSVRTAPECRTRFI